MSKMGRPVKKLDQDQFEKLCAIQATEVEIASWFDCSIDTVCRWSMKTYGCTFADIYKKKSSVGRISLRRKQVEVAHTGNVTMLIWLGKQLLGQKDKMEHFDGDEALTDEQLKDKIESLLNRKVK